MDHTAHDQSIKPCAYKDADKKVVEPGKLLEEFWFFENLLETKTKPRKMLRSFSDTCSLYDHETYNKSIKKLSGPEESCMERKAQDFEDEETEYSMGKLIRQASLNSSIPQSTAYKGLTKGGSNISRQRSVRPRQLKTQKSSSGDHVDYSCEELLQGNFKDLGLQEYKRIEEDEEKDRVWAGPPAPRWGGKRSTEEMKAQIKFWARAVASNVRQEC